MQLVIYGDFNCPYSFLASARADRLIERGIADVEWRAVEHDPAIPTPSEPVVGELEATLDREVDEVRHLARPDEHFSITRPSVHPNSAPATASFAGAAAVDADPDGVRRHLFAALWIDDRDIGDPSTVASLAAGQVPPAPAIRARWQEEWERMERRVVPMLVLPDGYISRGLGALARLADLSG